MATKIFVGVVAAPILTIILGLAMTLIVGPAPPLTSKSPAEIGEASRSTMMLTCDLNKLRQGIETLLVGIEQSIREDAVVVLVESITQEIPCLPQVNQGPAINFRALFNRIVEKLHATLKNIKLKDIDGKGSLKYEYKRPNSNDGVTFTIPVGTLFGSLFGGYTACTEYAKCLQTIQSSEETLENYENFVIGKCGGDKGSQKNPPEARSSNGKPHTGAELKGSQ